MDASGKTDCVGNLCAPLDPYVMLSGEARVPGSSVPVAAPTRNQRAICSGWSLSRADGPCIDDWSYTAPVPAGSYVEHALTIELWDDDLADRRTGSDDHLRTVSPGTALASWWIGVRERGTSAWLRRGNRRRGGSGRCRSSRAIRCVTRRESRSRTWWCASARSERSENRRSPARSCRAGLRRVCERANGDGGRCPAMRSLGAWRERRPRGRCVLQVRSGA